MTEQATDRRSALEDPDQPMEEPGVAASPSLGREFDTRGLSLRGFAARGMAVNTAFDVALQLLSLLRGFLIAALLTRSDYGVWGILAVSLGVLSRLKLIGVSDRYIQQDDPDQELAFQQAFTMEAIVTAATMAPLILALPIVGVVYGHWKVVPPGAVILLALPAQPFSAAVWVFYRRMQFARARLLQALDPVTSFVVTVGLAVAGVGYWALVGGLLAGAWSTAIACGIRSPYRYRWRFDRRTMRIYRMYTWPILVSVIASIVLANSASIAVNIKLGLAGVGVVALVASITAFSTNVDDIVSGTIYPAICAVQDRLDLLRESFQKANRLALMWAMPFGIGLALFSADLVRYGLGKRWEPAVGLLQITGVVVAFGHIGFNWDDYLRARAVTKPIGQTAVATAAAFLAIGVPLTLSQGFVGLGIGIAAQAFVSLGFRVYYLRRLFPGFAFARHSARAAATTAPAAATILVLRALVPGFAGLGPAIAELALFLSITAATTWIIEGGLLREAAGYMLERRRTVVT